MSQKQETAIVEVIIKGSAANSSLKDMERAAAALRAQLKRMPQDAEDFAKKTKEFQNISSRVRSLNNELKGTSSAFREIGKAFAGFSLAMLAQRGISAIAAGFKQAIQVQREFEKSIQNLSAITGASGKDLEFYGKKAIEMSKNVAGGAKSVVEAYKLIASAKPELLQNKEALTAVTEAAILLSQAAGLELPDAATRLTDALNQFGAPASEAAKYVDALAAASKYGAAEVPQVTEALLKFGVAAKSSNIDIYESAAAIELLAEKGLKGADAGTALRNVFAKMSAADVLPERASELLEQAGVNIKKLKDNTIPLSERLTELSKIQGNAAAITKVFGLENKNAGEILISNLPRLEELNKLVQENGVASDQSAKNMDTFDQSIIAAGNAWDNLTLSITKGGFVNALKTQIDQATAIMQGYTQLFSGTLGQNQNIARIQSGARGKTGARTGISEEQAKRLDEYGMRVSMTTGKLSAQQIALIDLTRATDKYISSLDGSKKSKAKGENYIEALQIKAQQLNNEFNKGAIDVNTYVASINLLNAQIAKTKALVGGDKPVEAITETELTQDQIDRAKQLHDKLLSELNKITLENSEAGLTEFQKKDAEIWREHYATLKRINDDGLMTASLKEKAVFTLKKNTADKIIALEKEMNDKLKEEEKNYIAEKQTVLNNDLQNEIDAINQRFDKLIADAKKFNDDTVALEEERQLRIAQVRQKYADGQQGSANGKTKSPADLDAERIAKLRQEINDIQLYYNEIEQIGSMFYQAQKNRESAEENAAEAKYQEDIAREKRLVDKKIISQETYEERIQALEIKKQNRERLYRQKQYVQEKNAARYNTIINGAEAIGQIWSKHAANPITAGFLTALSGGITLAKLAIIEGQQAPAYAKGGLHDPQGFVNQATMFNSASGQPFMAGEAGAEYIIPSWMLQQPIVANQVAMLEATRTGRNFAQGGSSVADKASGGGASGGNSAMSFGDLAAALNRLNANLEGGIGVNYDQFTRQMDSINNAKSISQVS